MWYFNPRTSCEVRHALGFPALYPISISIHAPRVRCDYCTLCIFFDNNNFNPRTSCEVRPNPKAALVGISLFQSTHLVWGATRVCKSIDVWSLNISIHAPRVRCDRMVNNIVLPDLHFNPRTSCEVRHAVIICIKIPIYISIHAPRVRCDSRQQKCLTMWLLFQSTHLVWGATAKVQVRTPHHSYFNPRTSCEVRPLIFRIDQIAWGISIHAPRVRCDQIRSLIPLFDVIFQSTHLVWGATAYEFWRWIEIQHFNPRTSCEVRHNVFGSLGMTGEISIHAPRVRCDLFEFCCFLRAFCISIHAPRVRCDLSEPCNSWLS